jgi:hypothetical protein
MQLVKRFRVSFLVLLAVVIAAGSAPVGAFEPKCYWVCDENTSCDTRCTWDGEPATCGEFGICAGQ